MNERQTNYRSEVKAFLEEWSSNPGQERSIINCLVEFLSSDITWLNRNISKSDLVILKNTVKRIRTKNEN